MFFLTVQGQTYNLDHLVRFVTHTGRRQVGTDESLTDPEPIFEDFRYVELIFSDGTSISLDGPQTEAFLNFLARRSQVLDLDKVEEATVGHIVVRDTEEGGDIILPTPAEDAEEAAPLRVPLPDTANPKPQGL
jgi:hypothetical protein